MIVNFLAAADNTPLTKTFSSHFGVLTKSAYPNVRDFNSFSDEVNSTPELYAALFVHAEQNHCMVKGALKRELSSEPRRNATDPLSVTQWIVFDVDHLPGVNAAEQFVALLPPEFHNTSYILQYSSSHGFSQEEGLRAHIFFLLATDVMPTVLKLWMKRLNLKTPAFAEHLRLAEGGCTLKWPVDISVNQNDKLIYIAPPLCIDIADPVPLAERIVLVTKTDDRVALDVSTVNAETVKVDENKALNAMREAAGLDKKRLKIDNVDGYSVIRNADQMTLVAPPFVERDFVYMPIGSNRHTYYHPVGKHEFLYSFKDPDIAFPMQVVLPSYYWHQEREQVETGPIPKTLLAFRDRRSDCKYLGTYSNDLKMTEFNRIKAREDISDFYTQSRQREPDIIETWDYEFDPTTLTRIAPDRKWINKFVPSMYIEAQASTNAAIPPNVALLLRHIMNYDDECYDHFLNWLAFKFQTRQKCKTAWFFQGIEGTGKGVLFNKILAPLFGSDYCLLKRMDNLLDRFNAELETSLIWVLDEANIENFKEDGQIVEKLKNLIVEDTQVIRAMHTNQYSAKNYTDVILFSNQTLAIKVSPTDRRYNVCPRQNTPLVSVMNRDVIATLERDLPQFANFLASIDVDVTAVAEPLNNQAKQDLVALSRTTHDEFIHNLMSGDLMYFVRVLAEQVDVNRLAQSLTMRQMLAEYVRNLHNNQQATVSVELIARLYTFVVNAGRSATPTNKMARMLSLRGCRVQHSQDEQSSSIEVTWHFNELALQRWLNTVSSSSNSSPSPISRGPHAQQSSNPAS